MNPGGGFDPQVLAGKGSSGSAMLHGHRATVASLHEVAVAAAVAHVDSLHRARCTDVTPVLFVRLDCHGVGGDLNSAVRGLAAAVDERRQMVLLPPEPSKRSSQHLPAGLNLTVREPWHWLAGQGLPLETVFVKSACHRRLERRMPEVLEAIAQSDELAQRTAQRLGQHRLANASKDFGQHMGTISAGNWRKGMRLRMVPPPFQRQGLLWWFQVLTSYLVRVRGELRERLQAHRAARQLQRGRRASATSSTAARPVGFALCGSRGAGWPSCACPVQEAAGAAAAARRGLRARGKAAGEKRTAYCDGIGPGWAPDVSFDAGLHIRGGDACGAQQPQIYRARRGCGVSNNLSAALELLRGRGVRRGELFVATDSASVVAELERGAAAPFAVTLLNISRAHYASTTPTEMRHGRAARLRVLLEALLDVLLLSRAEVIVGPMMSNFARVAVQLRVQPPMADAAGGPPRYVPLDGRPWCTRTSCKFAYHQNQGFR